MELTAEEALRQGIAAQGQGNVQEAERLYRFILQTEPLHPDANHNLGVLAVASNRTETALPLFKAALKATPKIEQFWFSYIDALMKEQQFEGVKQALFDAKKAGVFSDRLGVLMDQSKAIADGKVPSQALLNNLLECYETGRYADAEKLALFLTQEFPEHPFGWKVLGATLQRNGRNFEAVNAFQKSVVLAPQDVEAHVNLGVTLKELGRLEEAEASYRQAIVFRPDFADAYYNLGVTLKELGRLEEAEASYRQATVFKPDFAEAHNNLGVVLQKQDRPDEAEVSYTKAIELKSDFAEAHNNLGVSLQDQDKFDEAEASHKQAIVLNSDYSDAHSNLGTALKELGRLDEAEISLRKAIGLKSESADAHYNLGITLRLLGRLNEAEVSIRQAIMLKPNYAEAYWNLGLVLYLLDDVESGLGALQKARDVDSKLKQPDLMVKQADLMFAVLNARKSRGESQVHADDLNKLPSNLALVTNPLILNRSVEKELIANLYEMNSSSLARAPGPRYGNGRCSPDYELFDDDRSIIKAVAADLIKIMKLAVKSEIFVHDSFFNIYGSEAGIPPHNHLNKLDRDMSFNLAMQKYSLVYYLTVGNQDCSDPGILKLYDPEEKVLPTEGMIMIFPAKRFHSAFYNGKTDRVMIGINFYSL